MSKPAAAVTAAAATKAAPAPKAVVPVEKKLEMSLTDISKATPKNKRADPKARKTAGAGDKAAAKKDEVKGKRQKALDGKRGKPAGAVSTPNKAGANKAKKAGGTVATKKAATKSAGAGVPRLVIQADLTKIGRPAAQKPKKKQAGGNNKKPAVRLH